MANIAVEDLDRSQVDSLATHLCELVDNLTDVNNGLFGRLAGLGLTEDQLATLNEWNRLTNQLNDVSDAYIARITSQMS